MAQNTFNAQFMGAFQRATFNPSSWTPCSDKFSLKDVWAVTNPGQYEAIAGDTAPVISTTFSDGSVAKKIKLSFKDGTSLELRLSGKSDLEAGDTVKVSTITCQQLRKLGSEDIVRFDAELA